MVGRLAPGGQVDGKRPLVTIAKSLEQREETLKKRIARLIHDAKDMKEQRNFVLSVMPTEHTELRTIFSDRPDSVKRQLEAPNRFD